MKGGKVHFLSPFYLLLLPFHPATPTPNFPAYLVNFFPLAVFFLWKMKKTNPTKQQQNYAT